MGRAQQRFAHPDDDYVPPERGEPQIQPVSLHDQLPEPESLTDQPPPLPPPASLVVAQSSQPPAAATAPGSLPAGALVPKKGQRADVQRMSKADSASEATSSRGRLAGLANIVGNA